MLDQSLGQAEVDLAGQAARHDRQDGDADDQVGRTDDERGREGDPDRAGPELRWSRPSRFLQPVAGAADRDDPDSGRSAPWPATG